jgi:hypothetical protein
MTLKQKEGMGRELGQRMNESRLKKESMAFEDQVSI